MPLWERSQLSTKAKTNKIKLDNKKNNKVLRLILLRTVEGVKCNR